jgi:hypothetical protein
MKTYSHGRGGPSQLMPTVRANRSSSIASAGSSSSGLRASRRVQRVGKAIDRLDVDGDRSPVPGLDADARVGCKRVVHTPYRNRLESSSSLSPDFLLEAGPIKASDSSSKWFRLAEIEVHSAPYSASFIEYLTDRNISAAPHVSSRVGWTYRCEKPLFVPFRGFGTS